MLHSHALRWLPAALALVLATAPLPGCTKQLEAETTYADDVDFSRYETYRWITDDLVLIQPGTGDPKLRNVDNERRIRAAVERELASRGLRKLDADADADLIVAFTLGTKVRYQIQGGSTPLEMVADEPAHVTRGTLTLYLFDRARNEQVWSAWTKKQLEPGDDPDAVIDAAVAILLDEFPPSGDLGRR